MLVAVTRRIHKEELERLGEVAEVRLWDSDLPPSPSELQELVSGADGVLSLLTDKIDGAILDGSPGIKVVSNFAVGFDNINVPACTERGVAVCTTPDVLTETTAEFAMALIFSVARQIVPGERAARGGEWKTWYPMRFLGRDLAGATLGVVGLGRIGSHLATMASAFGMEVVYFDPRNEDSRFEKVDLDELWARSDIISLHVPLTDQTRGLVGGDTLPQMKPDAILINTSRGPVIDTDALVESLRSGHLAGVGLDVTDPEPLPQDHPLYTFDRVTIAPHIASATHITRRKMAQLSVDNVIAVLTGTTPPNCLNPEVL
ncbi:MAG: D-glycerate dehydrogenase [Chloroflexia bacterium]|nr:D-glycerate dehydrogenase [Chloroflexia bacterium]